MHWLVQYWGEFEQYGESRNHSDYEIGWLLWCWQHQMGQTAKCWGRLMPNMRHNVKVRGVYWQHKREIHLKQLKGRKIWEPEKFNCKGSRAEEKVEFSTPTSLLHKDQFLNFQTWACISDPTHWQKEKPCSDQKEPCYTAMRVYRIGFPISKEQHPLPWITVY